jgi:hypothetical protein
VVVAASGRYPDTAALAGRARSRPGQAATTRQSGHHEENDKQTLAAELVSGRKERCHAAVRGCPSCSPADLHKGYHTGSKGQIPDILWPAARVPLDPAR